MKLSKFSYVVQRIINRTKTNNGLFVSTYFFLCEEKLRRTGKTVYETLVFASIFFSPVESINNNVWINMVKITSFTTLQAIHRYFPIFNYNSKECTGN